MKNVTVKKASLFKVVGAIGVSLVAVIAASYIAGKAVGMQSK